MANPEHLKILKQGVHVWNQWRTLSAAKLHYLDDYPQVDLMEADLRELELSHANLRGVSLTASNLRCAKLGGADLRGADLFAANLDLTDLDEADLREACLRNALLNQTFLNEAVLDEARFGGTVFARVDLRTAKGLERAIHTEPSSIDLATLFESVGRIPESFLRGCGLSEEFMRYLPSLCNRPFEFYSCFVSYSHEDKAFARLLHDRLQGHGIRCWLDEHQLLPGDDLHESIDRGIRLWDKVLLCASQASLTSWWVDGEINRAFQKEAQIMKERGKKVLALIPLNLDGFLFSADYQRGKKAEITSRVAANFVGWEKDHALFDRELEKVIRALRTGEGGREKPPPLKL